MKYITTTFIIFVFFFTSIAQEKYSKVRIELHGSSLAQIAKLGIDVTEGTYVRGEFYEADLGSSELKNLIDAGIEYIVVHDNVSEFYALRAAADQNSAINRDVQDEWVIPENWEYGSMGGFYTLSEVMDELDDMYAQYPDLISEPEPLSTSNLTHDGRLQYWVRIFDNSYVKSLETIKPSC